MHYRDGKKVGVYLDSGAAICVKTAFKSEDKAIARLEEIPPPALA